MDILKAIRRCLINKKPYTYNYTVQQILIFLIITWKMHEIMKVELESEDSYKRDNKDLYFDSLVG